MLKTIHRGRPQAHTLTSVGPQAGRNNRATIGRAMDQVRWAEIRAGKNIPGPTPARPGWSNPKRPELMNTIRPMPSPPSTPGPRSKSKLQKRGTRFQVMEFFRMCSLPQITKGRRLTESEGTGGMEIMFRGYSRVQQFELTSSLKTNSLSTRAGRCSFSKHVSCMNRAEMQRNHDALHMCTTV